MDHQWYATLAHDVCSAIRLALSLVLATAAVAKLTGPTGFKSTLVDLHFSDVAASAVARVLPLLELAVAVGLLVPGATAVVSVIGACALFLGFTGVLAAAVHRGVDTSCRCFGAIVETKPISYRTVARTAVLAAAAGAGTFGATTGVRPVVDLVASSPWHGGALAGWVAAVLAIGVCERLLRRLGVALLQIAELETILGVDDDTPTDVETAAVAGLAVGRQAPPLPARTLAGSAVSAVVANGPALVVFTHTGCAACEILMPRIALAAEQLDRAVVVVSAGPVDQIAETADLHRLRGITCVDEEGTATNFHVPGTPAAVLLSQTGDIASVLALGGPAIEALVAELTADQHRSRRLELVPSGSLGTPALAFDSR